MVSKVETYFFDIARYNPYLTGALIVCQQVGAHMIKQKKGEVINITSICAHNGNPWDIALLVRFLASEASGWITGQTVVLDGGLMGRGVG